MTDINTLEDYLQALPTKRKLSEVKLKILSRLWESTSLDFPRPWVSSKELLELTGQKYFDRRTRELRDQLGCDLESSYQEAFSGHAWRLVSLTLSPPQDREYLTAEQKTKLFKQYDGCCATCGLQIKAGVRGLQADHKVPLSRQGNNDIKNWQPMCHNCNIGKRRACDGCELECSKCSWAFPETIGVPTMLHLKEATLRQLTLYSKVTEKNLDTLLEEAISLYIETNQLSPL